MKKNAVLGMALIAALFAVGFTASMSVGGAASCRTHHGVCGTTSTSTSTPMTTSTTPSPPSPPVPVGSLLFGDEFNGISGSEPAASLWAAKLFHNSNSICYFDGWNLIRENGSGDLSITAQKDSSGNWNCGYIAGAVSYSGARYVEARAKVPCGAGTWAAPVWETGHGAPQFEDDVIEQLGREPNAYHSSLHYWYAPGQSNQSGRTVTATSTLCNGFHTYGAAVYSDHVDFYLDGAKAASVAASAVGLADLTKWQDEINIDLDMGGSWAGAPTITGTVSMLVDYVHVYRLTVG